MPRITWSPDGRRVLICDRGVLRIATLDGTTIRELAPREVRLGTAPRDHEPPGSLALATFLDGRWLRDGRIMALDRFALPVQFTMQGAQYSDPEPPPNPWRVEAASLADGGEAFVAVDRALIVHATDVAHTQRWRLINDQQWYRLPFGPKSTAAMAGPWLAITYWTMAISAAQPAGWGWCVLDVTPRPVTLSGSWEAPLVHRDWIHGGESAPVFAFDRAGRRMAIASHAPVGSGVIRLGAPLAEVGHPHAVDPESRSEELAGARLVALDEQGARAVYAFPGSRELRFDYLVPQAAGPRHVDVIDSQRIDPGIEVVAFAFDPSGHELACLDRGGAVVIVPVP